MVLRRNDFAGWKINWNDKAENIVNLAEELNIGVDSVVFIDDNPYERARIRDVFPDVAVPDWPEDPCLYRETLLSLPYFDTATMSREDIERAGMYMTERKRTALLKETRSIEEWLYSLNISVNIKSLVRKRSNEFYNY